MSTTVNFKELIEDKFKLPKFMLFCWAAAEPGEQGHKAAKQAIQIQRERLRDYSVGIAEEW